MAKVKDRNRVAQGAMYAIMTECAKMNEFSFFREIMIRKQNKQRAEKKGR